MPKTSSGNAQSLKISTKCSFSLAWVAILSIKKELTVKGKKVVYSTLTVVKLFQVEYFSINLFMRKMYD